MSFIHDALKKSEAERQRRTGPALLEMRIVRPARRLPGWAIAVGALLVVNVAVLGWLALRPAHPGGAAATPGAAVATQPPASAPLAAMPAAAGATPGTAPAPNTEPPGITAPNLTTARAGDASAPGSLPATSSADAAANDAGSNPADLEPAVIPTPGTVTTAPLSSVHSYAELSGKLPELRLDLHVYATNPADRYAFINMHKVREGEVTAEGAQVREITREGVVLEYHGTEFLLGRE